jgi:hypothetical protein
MSGRIRGSMMWVAVVVALLIGAYVVTARRGPVGSDQGVAAGFGH